MELCRRVEGCDKGDLLCVEASKRAPAVATGSEARALLLSPRRAGLAPADAARAQEGTVCVFDARSFDVTARLRDAGGAGDAVTSLAFHPGTRTARAFTSRVSDAAAPR